MATRLLRLGLAHQRRLASTKVPPVEAIAEPLPASPPHIPANKDSEAAEAAGIGLDSGYAEDEVVPERKLPSLKEAERTAQQGGLVGATGHEGPKDDGGHGGGRAKVVDQGRLRQLMERMEAQARETVMRRRQLHRDRQMLSRLGSVNDSADEVKASSLRLSPPSSADATLAALVAAQCHLGHHRSRTSPHFHPFVYGTRADVSIIDLSQTLTYLRRAANVVRDVVEQDGIVVFLRGPGGSEGAIQKAAARLEGNGYAVTGRWLPGTMTNATGVLAWPRSQLQRSTVDEGKRKDLDALKFLPSLVVVPSPHLSRPAMQEAALRNVPTVGITDSDVDPRVVAYPIPANDDAVRSVELIVGILGRAGEEGLRRRREKERFARPLGRVGAGRPRQPAALA